MDKKFKTNPKYKKQMLYFKKELLTNDIVCTGMTYCIIPLKEINEAIAQNQPDFLYKKIEDYYTNNVDMTVMQKFESIGLINWWTSFCRRLYVSSSKQFTNDFLYNSISIGMWGFTELAPLYEDENIKYKLENIRRRWELQMVLAYKEKLSSVPIDEMFNSQLRTNDAPADRIMFGDLHAYILSNVIKRPILIFGCFNLPAQREQGIYTHVYLPMEYEPDECCKYPLIVACLEGKYFPILQMEAQFDALADYVPLVNMKCEFAEVMFGRDPGESFPSSAYMTLGKLEDEHKLTAMMAYMDVILIERPSTTAGEEALKYPCARLSDNRPFYYNEYRAYKISDFDITEGRLCYANTGLTPPNGMQTPPNQRIRLS